MGHVHLTYFRPFLRCGHSPKCLRQSFSTLRASDTRTKPVRSDWAPDPAHPLPKFSPPRRVPHGVTLIGRLFDEGTIARAGLALERTLGVVGERPPGFSI